MNKAPPSRKQRGINCALQSAGFAASLRPKERGIEPAEIKFEATFCKHCQHELPPDKLAQEHRAFLDNLSDDSRKDLKYLADIPEEERAEMARVAAMAPEERRQACPQCHGKESDCTWCASFLSRIEKFGTIFNRVDQRELQRYISAVKYLASQKKIG